MIDRSRALLEEKAGIALYGRMTKEKAGAAGAAPMDVAQIADCPVFHIVTEVRTRILFRDLRKDSRSINRARCQYDDRERTKLGLPRLAVTCKDATGPLSQRQFQTEVLLFRLE